MIRRFMFLAGLVSMPMLVGCADPAHEAVVARRTDNIGRTLDLLAAEEARRPENLANTAEVARLHHERDIERTRRNPGIVARAVESEFQRFHDRQPLYQRRIAEELRGNPETIERALPYVLY